MTVRGRSLPLLLAIAVAGMGRVARADDHGSSENHVVAETLFNDGRRAMAAGDTASACNKLGEAYRLEPGIGILLNLATCHVLQGKTATAWGELDQARSQAARANREKNVAFAREQMAKLEPRLARVSIVAADVPAGLVLELDGQTLGGGALASAFPVDPGRHQLLVRAPGRVSWKQAFDVAPGPSERTIQVPPLGVAPARLASGADATHEPELVAVDRRRDHTASWVLGGIALAGLGAGTALGIVALEKNSDASAHCHGSDGSLCSSTGISLDSQARTYGWSSTGAFVVGIGAGVASAVLLLVKPSKTTELQARVGPLGAAVTGTFP